MSLLRIVIPGESVYAYDISEDALLTRIRENKPFNVQRMLGGSTERVVTLIPQHITSFYEE